MKLQHLKQDADIGPKAVTDIKRNVNQLMEGSTNACGAVTLTNGGTTTVLYDNHINPQCKIFLFPQTANAAAVTGLWYDLSTIPVLGNTLAGQITLKHASSAHADLTFGYVIVQ